MRRAKTEAKHGERLKERRRQWKQDNRETVNRQRREAGKRNREKEKIHCHNYRARKRALPNTLTLAEWESICAEQDNACYYCGAAAVLVVEHMIPLSKGGGTTKDNCCGSCLGCNSSKRDRTAPEFIAYRSDIGKPLEGRVVS